MNDIERKALELATEIRKEAAILLEYNGPSYQILTRWADCVEALCRAIEQHEAFRQEVSDAVKKLSAALVSPYVDELLSRFIIVKPDPLVEAMAECGVDPFESWADQLRAALAKRGLEIREKHT